jgi:uncharacterized protein YndB with AHSA1/START domain
MAFRVEESILIDRPREEVWDYVMAHNDWRRPEVLEVRKLTDGPAGEGARYEDTVQMMGREMTVVNEISQLEPPSYISWSQVGEEGPAYSEKGSYELESVNGKTRFTLAGRYRATGFWRLLVPMIRRRLQNDTFPRYLRQLKEGLES